MIYHKGVSQKGFYCLLFLLLCFPQCLGSITVTENTRVNGVIGGLKMEEFVVSSKIDWKYFQFTFSLLLSEHHDEDAPIAQLLLFCNETRKERDIYNNVTLSLFSRENACSKETTGFILTNMFSENIEYSLIVQRMDDITAVIQMNSEIHGSIQGFTTDSFLSYRIYISNVESMMGDLDEEDEIVDMFQIHLQSSAPSSLKAYLSQSAYPLSRNRVELMYNETTQQSSILVDFSSPLYNLNHDIYLILIVEEPVESIISFSLQSECKSSLRVPPNSIVSGVFEGVNNTESLVNEAMAYAILDLTSMIIYDDIHLVFTVENYTGAGSLFLSSQTLRIQNTEFERVDGTFPLQYTLYRNSSFYHLRGVVYLMITIPDFSASSFTVQANFTQNYVLNMLDYDTTRIGTSDNKTSLQYYALWIPAEEFGSVEKVRVILSDIHYFWSHNGTVCTPLSMYVSFNEELTPSSILDSSRIKKEETIHYQTAYSTDIVLKEFGLYMIIAIETEGVSSWNIQTPITISPYAPTPGSPVQGYVSTYESYIKSYIYLYALQYSPVVLSVSKLSRDYRSLIFLVAINNYPTLDDYDWREEHEPSTEPFSVNITISRTHPKYCSKCKYYMTVYLFNSTMVAEDATYLSLDFLCSPEYCSRCSEGWDPHQNCKECLEGYYGTSCLPCPNCNHGKCYDRQVGNGTCVCDTGFTEASNCTDCSSGYYGEHCLECPFCNNHGTCKDGIMGDGSCECTDGFDPLSLCSNCLSGRFGENCAGNCPGNRNCNGHGVCDDGMEGTGRCSCHEGYVGIHCDTLYANDRCNPHCYREHGACNEETGVCVCWDNHAGIDCNYNLGEMINLYFLLVFIVILSIVSFVFIMRVKLLSNKKKKPTSKMQMVVDADNRTISWRTTTPASTPRRMAMFDTLHEEEEY